MTTRFPIYLLLLFSLIITLPACAELEQRAATDEAGKAKNVILFIGDGMGLGHVDAARLWSKGALGQLNIESMPVTGFSRTSSANAIITDSAAGVTALGAGVRTYNGSINMTDKEVDPTHESRPLETLADLARRQGKSVGVISTANVTDATPAGFIGHVASRAQEEDLAAQVEGSGLTLLMGGGRQFFHPPAWTDPECTGTGVRKDKRDLAQELTAKGWTVVQSARELSTLDPNQNNLKLLGLFEYSHMQYDLDRPKDKLGEPSLAEMVNFAVRVLSRNPKGYFMMVEGAKIDKASHGINATLALSDLVALDHAVERARLLAGPDTLIVLTADHETGGLDLVGRSADDVVGHPGEAGVSDRPTTLAITKKHPEKVDIPQVKVHWGSSNGKGSDHTAIDVPVYATGPGALMFTGFQYNCDIPWKIARAMGTTFKDPVNLENREAFERALKD